MATNFVFFSCSHARTHTDEFTVAEEKNKIYAKNAILVDFQ